MTRSAQVLLYLPQSAGSQGTGSCNETPLLLTDEAWLPGQLTPRPCGAAPPNMGDSVCSATHSPRLKCPNTGGGGARGEDSEGNWNLWEGSHIASLIQ